MSIVPGVGKKLAQYLNEIDVEIVLDLKMLNDEQMESLAASKPGKAISMTKLARVQRVAWEGALPGRCNRVVDYRKASNPYKERYGDDWENVIKHSSHIDQSSDCRAT